MATWLVGVLVAWGLMAGVLSVLVGRALGSLTEGAGGDEAPMQTRARGAGAASAGSRVELGEPQ